MEQISAVFQMFYYYFCDMAKWIFAIKIASDIIKEVNSGDFQGILKSVLNGSFGYAILLSVVRILDSIQAKF